MECKTCKQYKAVIDFRSGHKLCIDCERNYGVQYRREHKEKAQTWTENNKEKHRKLKAEWFIKNREQVKSGRTKKKDTEKQIQNYSIAIEKLMKGEQKTNKYLGCTKTEFFKWLKFGFEDQMSFDNYGEYWTLRYIIPLDTIKPKDEDTFLILTKWYNIRPVKKWKTSALIPIEDHIDFLKKFMKTKQYDAKFKQKIINFSYLQNTLMFGKPLTEKKIETCTECKLEKEIKEFHYYKETEKYNEICNVCCEAIKEKERKRVLGLTRKFLKDNPKRRIFYNLGVRLNISSNNNARVNTVLKYLNCSKETFLRWIESQFYGDLNWDNYGKVWHVDHCIPCISFSNDEKDIARCNHWSNLRPLLASENSIKNDSIQQDTILFQELKATVFKKQNSALDSKLSSESQLPPFS